MIDMTLAELLGGDPVDEWLPGEPPRDDEEYLVCCRGGVRVVVSWTGSSWADGAGRTFAPLYWTTIDDPPDDTLTK